LKNFIAILSIIYVGLALGEEIEFKVLDQTLKVSPLGSRGQNIYLNEKLVHFVPITNRADLDYAGAVIGDYGLNDSQREVLNKFLSDNFDSSLKSAESKDLVEASFLLGKEASKVMSKEHDDDCLQTKEKKEIVLKRKSKDAEIYCECELPRTFKIKDEDRFKLSKGFDDKYWDDFSLIGEVEEISLTLDTTNDNHLHGLWRKLTSKEFDGNDRGRTFGLNLDYKAVGDLGEIQIAYESVLFTQLKETSPGSNLFYVDGEGNYYQDQVERNKIDFKILRKYGLDDQFIIGGFELQQTTDDGKVVGPIQDAWHELFKEQSIQYNNQEFMEDDIDLTLYGGIGKDWFSDLGNWKCRTRLEGTAGVNVLDANDVFAKGRGEIELSSDQVFGGSKDNPWFLISLWAEGSVENQGENEYGAGVRVRTPIKVKEWTIEPQIGMSLEADKHDHMFTQSQSTKIEPQSHLGITFRRKF
jgi:hypothetical protein